jgi:DNA-binding protein H-NS
MSINLDALSIAELEQLKNNAAAMVEQKRDQAIKSAREQIQKIAADVGLSVEALMGLKKAGTAGKLAKKTGGAKKTSAGKKVEAKYRNPKNPQETWSGRGRKPVWLQAELDKGKKLESFAI